MPQALVRLEAELVVAHRRAGRRRRKRTAAWTVAVALAIGASSAVATVLLRDEQPIAVPGSPIALPASLRSQVDAASVRPALEAGGWAYFTAEAARASQRCLLAAPEGAAEVALSACDPASVVARRGAYVTHPGAGSAIAGAALIGPSAVRATVNGKPTAVRGGVVAFAVGPKGGQVRIETTDPAWTTTISIPDPTAAPAPRPYPAVTVTTPGGFGDR